MRGGLKRILLEIRDICKAIKLMKEVETMAVIYATLIVKGRKTINDVPEKIREQVQAVLIDLEVPELAE